jgi:hypothetical protein
MITMKSRTECELDIRKQIFCELPASECLDPSNGNHKRLKPGYSFCAWCGRRKHLFNFKRDGRFTLFCKDGNCLENYEKSLGSYSADLTNGVAYIWKYVKASEKSPRCKVPKREMNSNGQLIDLICMYCGVQSSNVISHPLVPEKYGVTSFCKNKICYSSFTKYVDIIAPERIPFAFSIDSNGELSNAYTVRVENREHNDEKKKTKHSPHSHSLAFKLPIVLNRDEFVHKDVGMWCPKSDGAIDAFRTVLLGAFCDFAQDCNAEELLKKVVCVKHNVVRFTE